MSLPKTAYPGLPLGPTSKYIAGPGTHVHNSQVVASISGTPSMHSSKETASDLLILTVARPFHDSPLHAPLSRSVVRSSKQPHVGSIVLGSVTRVTRERITLSILAVDGTAVSASDPAAAGILRREDVRGWETDRVDPAALFRVGDVVRAAVISPGDHLGYYLSTARNELGVLMARPSAERDNGLDEDDEDEDGDDGNAAGEGGRWMVPVSWKEFRDPRTGRSEERKVAKPVLVEMG